MKASVLMCVYKADDPEAFTDALSSVLSQTLLPEEFVLVADGPLTNKLDEIIANYCTLFDRAGIQFTCSRLPYNQGHGMARMHGLNLCKEDYVIICDADDINCDLRFEKLLRCFERDVSLDVVGSDIVEVDSITLEPLGIRKVFGAHDEIVVDLGTRCPFNQMSVALRKSAVISSGGYKSFFHNEDYYLWIRMFLNGCKFKNLNENLVRARVNKGFYRRRGGIKYFFSELKIQKILLKNKITNLRTFCSNVTKRFIVQVVIPGKLRNYVFKRFARVQHSKEA